MAQRLTFLVTVDEKLVRDVEQGDDTVFYARLERIIRAELRHFNEVKNGEGVHVRETTGDLSRRKV
jgi:hypothetical protein